MKGGVDCTFVILVKFTVARLASAQPSCQAHDTTLLISHKKGITGRSKEIIVLANGEKVAPTDMELAIAGDHLFDQVMIGGEVCVSVSEDHLSNSIVNLFNQ